MREVIDLKMNDYSYNQIVAHFAEHREISLTKHDIMNIILIAGKRARHLNGIYDAMVRDRFEVIEIDEQWQGNDTCYLGIVDKSSQYVYRFSRMAGKSRESFVRELEGLADVLNGLKVIITDGHPVYTTLIPDLFEGVLHVLCHVHAYRIFLKDAAKYHRQAAIALKSLRSAEARLGRAKHDLSLKRKQLRRLENKVHRIAAEYDAYRSMNGLTKWMRGAPWTTERLDIVARLNNARVCCRSKAKTVQNKKRGIQSIKAKIQGLKAIYMEKKQESLQAGKLLSWLKQFLSCPQEGFEAERARLIDRLERSKYKIASKMLKFLKDHPQLHPVTDIDLDALCKGFNASTNMVESFFGIMRPVLDKARRFSNSPQSSALIEILRLKHNFSSPFTGPNKHTTPLRRAGVNSRYENYLEALFPMDGTFPSPSTEGRGDRSAMDGRIPRRVGILVPRIRPDQVPSKNTLMNGGLVSILWEEKGS